MHEDQEGKPKKAFQTRVYDLADLRKDVLKTELPPMPQDSNLNEEERMKTGRWSEQFVYAYLQRTILPGRDRVQRTLPRRRAQTRVSPSAHREVHFAWHTLTFI